MLALPYYDIQEMNRVSPVVASVFDIYYDFYDSYFLVNDKSNATWEHPFFCVGEMVIIVFNKHYH